MNDRLREVIETFDDDEIVSVWNEYCEKNRIDDDRICGMYELNDEFCDCTATDLIDLIDGNHFSTSDNYYKHTIYGIESIEDVWDEIYLDDLIEFIIRENDDLGNDEIREVLESEDDDEESEGDEE